MSSYQSEAETVNADINELHSLVVAAKRDSVKQILQSDIARLNQRKTFLEKELEKQSQPASSQPGYYKTVSNFAWDQTKDLVKVYVEFDGQTITESDVKLDVTTKRSFELYFGNRKFLMSKLNKDIDAEKSYFKLTKTKVIVYLKKEKELDWPGIKDLEGAYKKTVEDTKEDLADDPSGGLMKMMKKMYDEGDDEMKRTITKSWYESQNKQGGGQDPLSGFGGM